MTVSEIFERLQGAAMWGAVHDPALVGLYTVFYAFLTIWLLGLGGCVGSFLNVVVYRLPQRMSLSHPGSRCPRCLHPIRTRDNLPVLSWMILGGRCRDCGNPIALRYPTVEAIVAVMFLAVAIVEGMQPGISLPSRTPLPSAWPLDPETMVWVMFGFHQLLLCTLLAAALIQYDRQPVPVRLFSWVLLAGVVLPAAWPQLRPLAAWSSGLPPAAFGVGRAWSWQVGLLEGLCGFVAGAAAAALALPAGKHHRGERGRETVAWLLVGATAGLCLGWQSVLLVAAAASLVMLVVVAIAAPNLRAYRVPWAAYLTAAAFGLLLVWRPAWILVAHAVGRITQAPLAAAAVLAASCGTLIALAALVIGRLYQYKGPPLREPAPSPKEETMPVDPQQNHLDILNSPSYRLARLDTDFLQREELRPVRMQLELLKPELALNEQGVLSTIVVFGGTQIVERGTCESRIEQLRAALDADPENAALQRNLARAERVLAKSRYYDEAREFSSIVSTVCQRDGHCDYVVVTGGGPGVMEAANRGAFETGGKSMGLNIILPAEQAPNPYITPELCFQFQYFAMRKLHFLLRAKALVVFPGGFGTLDELFDALTLRQTGRMQQIPIILYGKEYWDQVVDFQFLADEGVIADAHLDLISYANTPQEAWDQIVHFHQLTPPPSEPTATRVD